ncbi:MAG TPA: nuclear transport factor 2 family protein [Roseiflexaceae bacterium]|nr:nuclear transport factor 2 family protein [Roseiflexaceae bacterium]HMP42609.1 nuclear transport factor 2 family protein [Roseiflexaceae bacterium]
MESGATELLDAFNAAFNRHDPPAMMALMTVDCVFENTYPPPDGERYIGQAAVAQFWEAFFQASPAARIEIEELYAGRDYGFQRWCYHWIDRHGSAGHIRGVDIFHFRDGKIAAKLSYVKG